jgi:hypothetical protein
MMEPPFYLFFTKVVMALKSFALKFWKPTAVAGATVYGAYGTYQWNNAKSVLHVDGRKEELEIVFDSIDANKSGFINVDDLSKALNKSGKMFSAGDVKAMLAVADLDHDGKLSKKEFVQMCERVTSSKQENTHTMPERNLAELTKIDEEALESKYGDTHSAALPSQKKKEDAPHLTQAEVHDEVKLASAVKGIDRE